MNLLEALEALGADGVLLIQFPKPYRLIVRSGLVRAVYDEGENPARLMSRNEAENLLQRLAGQAKTTPATPGFAVHPVIDPVKSVYIPTSIFKDN